MAYTPTTWTDSSTQANAARLNKLEQGVKEAHDLAQDGTSGSGILNVSGTVNLEDTPGIREVYATATATVEGIALAAGDAAVFRYLAGAWSYMIVGTHTTWQSISLTPVTANTPTADDTANTITWTPKAGVQYVIGGQVRTSPYSVGDVTASVTVTAQATTGYTLTGTSSWTFNFTGSAPADTTSPTPGTLAVTGSGDAGTTRTLTVTGASDETALHATPYRFSTDGGSAWSAYQSSNAFTTAALSAGTYQPRVMVRDAAGNTATASAADFTVTTVPALTPEQAALALSPTWYLALDDAGGATTAVNRGTAGGTATVNTSANGPTFGAASIGGRGTAVQWAAAGGEGRITIPSAASGVAGMTSFTLSVVVDVTSTNINQVLVNIGGVNCEFKLGSAGATDAVFARVFNGPFASSVVTPGKARYTMTWDGATVRLYVNRSMVSSVASGTGNGGIWDARDVWIGNTMANSLSPGGRMSDVVFARNVVATQAQVDDLCAAVGL